jgi:hypothetical protein
MVMRSALPSPRSPALILVNYDGDEGRPIPPDFSQCWSLR